MPDNENLDELVGLEDSENLFDESMFDPDAAETSTYEAEELVPVQTVINSNDTRTITLDKERFSTFLTILKIVKGNGSCTDLTIKEGKICQLNDKKSMVFIADLTPILGNASMLISGLESKLELLEPFKKQCVNVFLDICPDGYVFRDSLTKIKLSMPVQEYIQQNNEWMSDTSMDTRIALDSSRRVFSYKFDKIILSRLLTYAKVLASPVLRILFNGDKACFQIQALDSTKSTEILLTELDDELDDTSINNLIAPFNIQAFLNFLCGEVEEIQSEVFHRRSEDVPSVVIRLNASVPIKGEDGGEIAVTICSAAQLASEDE
jgi:hypothetical protein